jgi:transcriptional regulator with XRE-family HTH domain
MQFNEYLKLCRENNALTQEELVHNLYSYDIEHFEGLDTSTLSKWERSITKPKMAKQIRILNYFQESTGIALPYLNTHNIEEAESLICNVGMKNILGKNKTYILELPSGSMNIDEFHVYPIRNTERMNPLLDINMDVHKEINHIFTQITLEQFQSWALHPSNLFLVCEYKNTFLGLLFTIRLKPEIYHKLLNFEMKKSDIQEEDFASHDEMGCNFFLSFYALSQKSASILFVRYYAHLIANQSNIQEIGGITTMKDAEKIAHNMNLKYFSKKITDEHIEIRSFSQTLAHVLASENVLKMILSKQECPEE